MLPFCCLQRRFAQHGVLPRLLSSGRPSSRGLLQQVHSTANDSNGISSSASLNKVKETLQILERSLMYEANGQYGNSQVRPSGADGPSYVALLQMLSLTVLHWGTTADVIGVSTYWLGTTSQVLDGSSASCRHQAPRPPPVAVARVVVIHFILLSVDWRGHMSICQEQSSQHRYPQVLGAVQEAGGNVFVGLCNSQTATCPPKLRRVPHTALVCPVLS